MTSFLAILLGLSKNSQQPHMHACHGSLLPSPQIGIRHHHHHHHLHHPALVRGEKREANGRRVSLVVPRVFRLRHPQAVNVPGLANPSTQPRTCTCFTLAVCISRTYSQPVSRAACCCCCFCHCCCCWSAVTAALNQRAVDMAPSVRDDWEARRHPPTLQLARTAERGGIVLFLLTATIQIQGIVE
ncbi:hypothetical protein FN846DRAFT_319358 [Sphaerosporella brunnea]|uniref:Uncharacterized protein n=1 Tax=Sphaerosporella brunnea TaxID=1250544 RepID=A0A5J5EL15_9PEZI|nr:hypothetical protein FN846DRAFT_319358 [Sphaerosporella brunnea]